jgi:hypothetical protein
VPMPPSATTIGPFCRRFSNGVAIESTLRRTDPAGHFEDVK